MRISILKSAGIFAGIFILILAFQNCSGTGLPYLESTDFALLENVEIDSSGILAAEGGQPTGDTAGVPGTDPVRDPGSDTAPAPSSGGATVPGSDTSVPASSGGVRDPATDSSVTAAEDAADAAAAAADAAAPASVTAEWLYIAGGRGHVPMSSVAICPPGVSGAGLRQCPFFCYKGGDYQTTRSDARNYFAKGFDKVPNYGGGAVPGTCAIPDLKLKSAIN